MDIALDANILFAITIKKGITERILMADDLHVYAPEYLLVEFKEHEKELLKITKRTRPDFFKLMDILERRIELIPTLEFKHHIREAETLLPDNSGFDRTSWLLNYPNSA